MWIDTDLGSVTESTRAYQFHQGMPMTYDIQIFAGLSSFSRYNLSYAIIKFTGGV